MITQKIVKFSWKIRKSHVAYRLLPPPPWRYFALFLCRFVQALLSKCNFKFVPISRDIKPISVKHRNFYFSDKAFSYLHLPEKQKYRGWKSPSSNFEQLTAPAALWWKCWDILWSWHLAELMSYAVFRS